MSYVNVLPVNMDFRIDSDEKGRKATNIDEIIKRITERVPESCVPINQLTITEEVSKELVNFLEGVQKAVEEMISEVEYAKSDISDLQLEIDQQKEEMREYLETIKRAGLEGLVGCLDN